MPHSAPESNDRSHLEPCNDFITGTSVLAFLIIPLICFLQSIVMHCFKLNCKQFGEVPQWILTECIIIRKLNPLCFPCCQWKGRNGLNFLPTLELTPRSTRAVASPFTGNRRSLWRQLPQTRLLKCWERRNGDTAPTYVNKKINTHKSSHGGSSKICPAQYAASHGKP